MNDWLRITFGLVLLVIASELLVRGSVRLALALGISKMVVGATLVAFGTSAPEMMVSTVAAWEGQADIAVGNVLGSNTFNIGFILGLSALLQPIRGMGQKARFEARFLVLVTVVTFVPWLIGDRITRVVAAAFVVLIVVFTWMCVTRERQPEHDADAPPDKSAKSITTGIVLAILGLVGLPFGADQLVVGATGVAKSLGLSESFIGLTIVAAGTSLPELATSVNAALRGHPEIALGNILGSNIFNVCAVLGVAALIRPLAISWSVDAPSLILAAVYAVATLIWLVAKGGLGRVYGVLCLASYAAYVGFLLNAAKA